MDDGCWMSSAGIGRHTALDWMVRRQHTKKKKEPKKRILFCCAGSAAGFSGRLGQFVNMQTDANNALRATFKRIYWHKQNTCVCVCLVTLKIPLKKELLCIHSSQSTIYIHVKLLDVCKSNCPKVVNILFSFSVYIL